MKILLTGGTGSFGQYATRHILGKNGNIKEIRVFSRDEEKQLEMKRLFNDNRLRFIIGNIKDYESVVEATENVELVIHAAALKHIPVCERQPYESVKTNLLGTINVKRAATACNVPKSVFLSTDKACNPVNVYGACKMLAERIWVKPETSGKFCSVRYGNIVGSRGSVIPFFHRLIKKCKPVTITHPDMTRFFITLGQATTTVFNAVKTMRGGETFVPRIKSCKIVDLAKTMTGESYPVEIVGVRPGEKLHETLISEDEMRRTEPKKDYFIIHPHGKYESGKIGTEYNSRNADKLTEQELFDLLEDWL